MSGASVSCLMIKGVRSNRCLVQHCVLESVWYVIHMDTNTNMKSLFPLFHRETSGYRKYIIKYIWLHIYYKQTKTLNEDKAMVQNHLHKGNTKRQYVVHIVAYTKGPSCRSLPYTNTYEGANGTKRYKATLIKEKPRTATTPSRIMCRPDRY